MAVPAVRANQPDLILLDLMLPDVDGFEICSELKRRRATNLVPIVMVTALNDPHNHNEGIRVGANEYLTKPFRAAEFFATIDRALAWRDEHMKVRRPKSYVLEAMIVKAIETEQIVLDGECWPSILSQLFEHWVADRVRRSSGSR